MGETISHPPRPLWRWWLFCLALDLCFRTDWGWPGRLLSWSVLPEWVASPEEIAASRAGRWTKTWDDNGPGTVPEGLR